MELLFIGTGSAFTVGVGNYQSNMVLTSKNGKRMLIDCGADARLALYEQGLEYFDIDAVYISHLHSDHVGGLEWLAFTKYFQENKRRIPLYISTSLVDELWNHVLEGGLSSLQGEEATLSSYFDVHLIEANGHFEWDGIRIHLVQTVHVISNYAIVPSYGLMISAKKEKIFLTTDTQFAPHQIIDSYNQATIIFQDCETSEIKSCIHASFEELQTLPEEIRAKMWLYHYNPGDLPDAREYGFGGFVQKGQKFTFKD